MKLFICTCFNQNAEVYTKPCKLIEHTYGGVAGLVSDIVVVKCLFKRHLLWISVHHQGGPNLCRFAGRTLSVWTGGCWVRQTQPSQDEGVAVCRPDVIVVVWSSLNMLGNC